MAERDHLAALRLKPVGYEEDYAAWLEQQINLLRRRRLAALDVDNLVDEVEGLSRSDYKAFVSAIEIVLLHMLKWDHQPTRRSRGWQGSIIEHRARIEDELTDSPSYAARLDQATARAYRTARAKAVAQTKLPLERFPTVCPYDWTTIVTREHPLDA